MTAECVTARAGANIALVKYWGKRDTVLNLPAAGSLSITLSGLETETRLVADSSLDRDVLFLNDRQADAARVGRVLDLIRELAGGGPYCRVESRNNFPTGAGLASSASAFAALVMAADQLLGLECSATRLSELARRGSGSAARSIFGGFVEMFPGTQADGSDCVATPLLAGVEWPLEVVVAITDAKSKKIPSTEGMNRTMNTSPFYPAWVESVPADIRVASRAIAERDFDQLAETAEFSALKMHASALAAYPGLIYWNGATVECMHRVRKLREQGVEVFFTIDAGPQVKAICKPGLSERVGIELEGVPGVERVIHTGLGEGARVIS
jgi:diphosphomevalonate decarboxylase